MHFFTACRVPYIFHDVIIPFLETNNCWTDAQIKRRTPKQFHVRREKRVSKCVIALGFHLLTKHVPVIYCSKEIRTDSCKLYTLLILIDKYNLNMMCRIVQIIRAFGMARSNYFLARDQLALRTDAQWSFADVLMM